MTKPHHNKMPQQHHNNTLGMLYHHRGLHVVRRMVVEGMDTLHGLAEPPDSTLKRPLSSSVAVGSIRPHLCCHSNTSNYELLSATPKKCLAAGTIFFVDFGNPSGLSLALQVLKSSVTRYQSFFNFPPIPACSMHQECFVLSLDWQSSH